MLIKSILATFISIVFFFVLLLLGQSEIKLYVLATGGLFFLLYGRVRTGSKFFLPPVIPQSVYRVWLVFFVAVLLASFFTHSLPASLDYLANYVFLFLLFNFTVTQAVIDHSEVKELLAWGFILIGIIFSFLSVFFFIYTDLAAYLPGMNLLYASYGHNHLAAYLLLILPLAWSQTFAVLDRKKSLLWLTIPLLLTSTLLLSFGRVAVSIGLIELLLIWWFYRDLFSGNKIIARLFFSLYLLFLLVLSIKMFFSLVGFTNSQFTCPFPQFQNQLCKPLITENRGHYWHQAVETIKDYPLTGYGPGTFKLINLKYRGTVYENTAFAHNAFLESLAEMGIIGGVAFAGLMFYLLKVSVTTVKKTSWSVLMRSRELSFERSLLMGIVAVYIDVLFDFDWNFIGIMALTIFFLAMIIRSRLNSKMIKISLTDQTNNQLARFQQGSYLLGCVFLITFGLLYGITSLLIKNGKTTEVAIYFPYFVTQKSELITNLENNSVARNKLLQVYAFDGEIYHIFLKTEVDPEQRFSYQKKLYQIDPWQLFYQDAVPYLLSKQRWEEADQILQQKQQLLIEKRKIIDYPLTFEEELVIQRQALDVARGFMGQEHKTERAADLYLKAYFFNKDLVWEYTNNWPEKENRRLLQAATDAAIKNKDFNLVIELLTLQQKNKHYNYFALEQLGDFYVWRSREESTASHQWLERATTEFKNCLIQEKNNHQDCELNLEAIQENEPRDRYHYVTQQILQDSQ